MIRDKINIYENLENLQKRCKTCFKHDHDVYTCSNVHYVARKDFIIKRHLYSKPQLERFNYLRSRKKLNARNNIKKIQENSFLFESCNPANIVFNDENLSEVDLIEIESSIEIAKEFSSPANNLEIEELKKMESAELDSSVISSKDLEQQQSLKCEKKPANEKEEFCKNTQRKTEKLLEININKNDLAQFKTEFKSKTFKQRVSLDNIENNNALQRDNSTTTLDKLTEENMKWKDQFENMHIFSYYFCHNNADEIIKEFGKKNFKKQLIKRYSIRKKKTISSYKKIQSKGENPNSIVNSPFGNSLGSTSKIKYNFMENL